MEKLVLINLSDSEYQKVKTIASRMKIATDRIPQEYLGCTLGQFADGTYKGKLEQPVSEEMQESVILFLQFKKKNVWTKCCSNSGMERWTSHLKQS